MKSRDSVRRSTVSRAALRQSLRYSNRSHTVPKEEGVEGHLHSQHQTGREGFSGTLGDRDPTYIPEGWGQLRFP